MASLLRPGLLTLIACVLLTPVSGFRLTKSSRAAANLSNTVGYSLEASVVDTIPIDVVDCGTSSYIGKVTGYAPKAIATGKTTNIKAHGILSKAVSGGSFNIHMKMTSFPWTSWKHSGDMCKPGKMTLRFAGVWVGSLRWKALPCPLKTGLVSVDLSVSLASFIPSGMSGGIVSSLRAKTTDGKPLLCAELAKTNLQEDETNAEEPTAFVQQQIEEDAGEESENHDEGEGHEGPEEEPLEQVWQDAEDGEEPSLVQETVEEETDEDNSDDDVGEMEEEDEEAIQKELHPEDTSLAQEEVYEETEEELAGQADGKGMDISSVMGNLTVGYSSAQRTGELFDDVGTTSDQILAQVDTAIDTTKVKASIDWDQVIVIGEKIWQIVKNGEAVKNIETKTVSVKPNVPWRNMNGWRFVKGESIRLVNVKEVITKLPVISLRLTPMMFYGGSYKGSGQYLKDVKLIPTRAMSSFGHYLHVKVIASEPHNIGRSANPIAQMTLTADIRYGTIPAIQKWSKRVKFIFSGSGQIRMVNA